jgi:hypothetical protein
MEIIMIKIGATQDSHMPVLVTQDNNASIGNLAHPEGIAGQRKPQNYG